MYKPIVYFSKKNIGLNFFNDLIKQEKRGCYRITLTCNNSLVSFYQKNGFKINNVAMKRFKQNEF